MILSTKSRARSLLAAAKNSAGGACSTIWPSSMKTIRSQTSRAKPISCVTTAMVMPSRARSRITSRTSRIISGSSADVGSSKSMSLGSIASARAIATRCCWPPERSAGYADSFSVRPTRSSSFSARSRAAVLPSPFTSTGAMVRFCMTVLWAKRLNCWKTIPISARIRLTSLPARAIDFPSNRTSPSSMPSSPLMQRSIVDFPEPDGPAMTTTSPRSIVRSIPSKTRLSPKLLRTRSSSTRCPFPALISLAWEPTGRRGGFVTPPPLSRAPTTVRPSMRLIVARCSVEYSGRLSARLPEALRLVMLKADGSVLVHADAGGYKPLNWMTPPTVVEEEGGRIVVRKLKGDDRLDIELVEVLSDVTHPMDFDADQQLARYLERIRLDPAMADCRGVLAAQMVKPQARVLAEARGLDWVEVDLAELRGAREPALTLFA